MKKTTCHCDVCGDLAHKDYTNLEWIAIFLTETTEGRSTTPYFSHIDIDLCEKCYKRCLEGVHLFATGAMGYNKYFFKGEEPK